MNTNELFMEAARRKFRFTTPAGSVTVEDLWDLPLTATSRSKANLDDVAIELDRQIKNEGDTTSFVKRTTRSNTELKMKFEIVKAVIEVRLAEQEAAEARATNLEKKNRILELIAKKQDEELAGKSVEELRELVGSL
jgi:hypothetical protein